MKRTNLVALACVVMLGAGCNGRKASHTTSERNTVGTAGEVSRSDRNFVNEQLMDGKTEVALAKLAKERAVDPEVTQFATMMIKDHTSAGDRLKQIAMNDNIPLETAAYEREKDAAEALSKYRGPDFDKQYMKMMVDDHEKAVRELRSRVDENRSLTERLEGKNPANPAAVKPEPSNDTVTMRINQWAAATLPTVERHLNRAKEIMDHLDHPTAATTGTTRKY